MKINFEDNHRTSIYNYGMVEEKYPFMVTTGYFSVSNKYAVDNIIWLDEEPPKKGKAEKRIKELALKINAK